MPLNLRARETVKIKRFVEENLEFRLLEPSNKWCLIEG